VGTGRAGVAPDHSKSRTAGGGIVGCSAPFNRADVFILLLAGR
jgi:hypothetical protein